ncbi:MAG TPA: DUF934 domain-containing protein [Methylophilaceae bacterium]|nr:DUF934 domain-containing protein [Methylophilaceae bacterium]
MSNATASNLIAGNAIVPNEWTLVRLPVSEEAVRKQAGKVVLYKLTGEAKVSEEQIAATEIPATGKVLVPLSVWRARKAELTERLNQAELGVWLDTHEPVETLGDFEPDLNIFPLIAVHVERSADGRIFSIGRLLRTRYGYNNGLRAVGDVLRDQLFFLKRCGFDSYLIRADRSAQEALASLKDFTEPYQGAVDIKLPVWRRFHRPVGQGTA